MLDIKGNEIKQLSRDEIREAFSSGNPPGCFIYLGSEISAQYIYIRARRLGLSASLSQDKWPRYRAVLRRSEPDTKNPLTTKRSAVAQNVARNNREAFS